MIDPHVHCAECHRAIATTIKVAGGKTKDAPLKGGTQPRVLPGPQGLMVVTVQVPLCDDCHERIAAQEAAPVIAAPKLILPQMGAVRQQ
jgi:uncharacterized protein YlaI